MTQMSTPAKLVEYAPGQYGTLVRTGSDSRDETACATCGKALGYAGIAARMGDGAKVHYMADRDRPGYVLDCVTEVTFKDGMAS